MKRLLMICVAAGLILIVTHAAKAAALTFEFKPNDLIDLFGMDFTTGLNATQDNARRVHEVWTSTWYQTFSDYLSPGTTQPGSGNTYLNWRDSLRTDEGLGSFNLWLRGGAGSQAWGEILLSNPDEVPTATAASGWSWQVDTNPWGTGYIISWYTTDPDVYIRSGGVDLGTFSFTADLYVDNNGNGIIDAGDTGAVASVPYRIWFGDTQMNEGNETIPALVFDNQGWPSRLPNYGTFAQTPAGDAGLEAILTLTGVPEPATIGLLGLGGLALLRKRRA